MGEKRRANAETGETRVERVAADMMSHRKGIYYIAPDSAVPLPKAIWDHLDVGLLQASAESRETRKAQSDKANLTPYGFAIGPELREILESSDSQAADRLLKSISDDPQSGSAI